MKTHQTMHAWIIMNSAEPCLLCAIIGNEQNIKTGNHEQKLYMYYVAHMRAERCRPDKLYPVRSTLEHYQTYEFWFSWMLELHMCGESMVAYMRNRPHNCMR